MPSCTDQAADRGSGFPGGKGAFGNWNRRLHTWLGLYLLFFVWLFAFSGLLLNHSQWRFAGFWDSRKETTEEHAVQVLASGSELARARDLIRQLGIRGEIDWTAGPGDGNQMEFRVSRPGRVLDVKLDLPTKKATVKKLEFNTWGILRLLHTFSGVRVDDERNERDWMLTRLWAWSMDAVATGLILMVLSSLVLWWRRPQKRLVGVIVLALDSLVCGLFCFGLRYLC